MKISVKEGYYFSQSDEQLFYEGLSKITGLKSINGAVTQLELEFEDELSDNDLRALLALFTRYGLDMRPLGQFLTESNRKWFYEKKVAYWHNWVWADFPLKRRTTQLVFCSPKVNPDEVTQVLGLCPSTTLKIGDIVNEQGKSIAPSNIGIWKFELSNIEDDEPIEHQIRIWIDELAPKADAFKKLVELGYRPYLDCKANRINCSACLEPEVLARVADLNIALSIWFEDR